jgi:3-oxoacyl-[acyl-carrier-protein] synthase-1
MNEPMAILNYGAVTAVGLSAPQTCAAIRANIDRFAESEFITRSPDPEVFVVAAVPWGLSAQTGSLFTRLVELASQAIRECLEGVSLNPARTALVLGLREEYRKHPELDRRNADFLPAIEQILQLRFHPRSTILPKGNAAGFSGLQLARTLLATGQVECCIVGGVDSYVNDEDMERFENLYRLKQPGVAQGFIPGEGAAFLAVCKTTSLGHRTSLGNILGIGLVDEDPAATILQDGHPTGKGVHRALEAACRDGKVIEASISFVVSDVNGEYYRGVDTALGQSRFFRTRREDFRVLFPAASVGEIGAAVAPLLTIVALVGMAKGYLPGVLAMCEASSDSGLRAACLVAAPGRFSSS